VGRLCNALLVEIGEARLCPLQPGAAQAAILMLLRRSLVRHGHGGPSVHQTMLGQDVELCVYLLDGHTLRVGDHPQLERLTQAVRLRAIPTIVVSTNPRYLEMVQTDPACYGHHRVLQKPFDLDDLLGAVEALIGPA
jgi:hypothetical protein